jgi:hypothetical protein
MEVSMQKSFFKISLTTIMISFLSSFSVLAAQEDYSNTWWVNLGAGAGTVFGYDYEDDYIAEMSDDGGLALTASFNYALTEHQLLTLRTSRTEADFWGLDHIFDEDMTEQLDGVYDIGLLYGLMQKNEYFLASAAAGLAYTAVEYSQSTTVCDDNNQCISSNYSDYTESTVGFPVEVQLFWTPTDVLGIGLIGLANFNSEASYAAGLLAIQVGNLR